MPSLNELWQLPSAGPLLQFRSDDGNSLEIAAKSYLSHAIAEGTSLFPAVRLEMSGGIKLKKKWLPFTATQVVCDSAGFIWSARVQSGLAFISGSDRFVNGVGDMKWKLLGLIPVMTGSGSDISRSAGGRYAIERVLLPSALCRPEMRWTPEGDGCAYEGPGIPKVTLDLHPSGQVKSVSMLRWGNPDGGAFGLVPFGGYVDEEATWNGYTIPSRLRIGWHFGTDRFADGEFFRAHVTHAEFQSAG